MKSIPLRIALVYLAAEALLRALQRAGGFLWLQEGTAWAARRFLGVLGQKFVLAGCSVVTSKGIVDVAPECIPFTAWAIAAALFFAAGSPGWLRRLMRVAGLVVGIAVLNVGRVAAVTVLVERGSAWVEPLHVTVFPVLLVVVVFAAWFIDLRSGSHD